MALVHVSEDNKTLVNGPNPFVLPDGTNFTDFISKKIYAKEPHTFLGQGTFATVYRLHFPDKQDYVLKHIGGPYNDLLKEVNILMKLKDKWFAVQLITASIYPDDQAYILYPFVEGKTFQAFQRNSNKMNTSTRKKLYTQIYNDLIIATYELHKVGIVHQDIKPPNIWIPSEGRPFFLDFGLSETLGAEKGLAGTSGFLNSRRWTNKGAKITLKQTNTGPQYVANKPVPVSSNINWYALGTVFNSYDPNNNSNVKARTLRKVGITNNNAKTIQYGKGRRFTRKRSLQ